MAQTWRTVRVFISSTFRDMHAERDYLVRVIFPELKERCRQRHIQLIDVDLRWGVTEKQAEGGGALDICLDEIDSCRPFFLGLLGHRYGSTPPSQEHSITAQEIYHGVLHNYLPRQVVDLRPIVEGILEGRTLLKEQVSCLVRCYQWDANKGKYLLQENVTPKDKEMLHSIFAGYSIYQRDRSFFFFRSQSLTEELRERSESKVEDYFETEEAARDKLNTLKQEIINAELPHFEYSDLETFGQMVLDTLWKRIDAEFPEERAPEERDWLQEEAEFHELFMAERTRRFVGRSDLLAQMHAFVEKDSDPRTLVITGQSGCGRSALMARFTEEVSKDHPDWLILPHFVGASPSSTSLRSMLRRFCTHLNRALGVAEEVPEDYKELAQLFPELLEKASEDRRALLIIDAVNQFEKTDNPQSMTWLPQALPENMRVVVSTLAGEALDSLKAWRIQPRFEKVSGLTEPEIEELVTKYLGEVRKEFPTKEISKAFYKKIKAGHPLYILVALEELRVFPIYEKLGERVAELPDSVPELFDQVLERVESDFSQPLVGDFMSFIACGRQGMTGEELQTLLKGHAPVVDPASPPQKLPDMLFARLRRAFSAYLFERSGVIDFFHRQLKEAVGRRYLPEETDREHKHWLIASYFEQRWAEPYVRALDELPHQLTKAKDWESVERILCDLHFIKAKVEGNMVYDLLNDFTVAELLIPPAARSDQSRIRKLFSLGINLSAADLSRYPDQLMPHLLARLTDIRDPLLMEVLSRAESLMNTKWLKPLFSCLEVPNEGLLMYWQAYDSSGLDQIHVDEAEKFIMSLDTEGVAKYWDISTGQEILASAGEGIFTTFQATAPAIRRDPLHRIIERKTSDGSCQFRSSVKMKVTLRGIQPRIDFGLEARCKEDVKTLLKGTEWISEGATSTAAMGYVSHLPAVTSLELSRDECILLAGCTDGAIRGWRIPELELCREFQACSSIVVALAPLADGRVIFGTTDGWLGIVSPGVTTRTIAVLSLGEPPKQITFTPGGQYLLCCSTVGTLSLWATSAGELEWKRTTAEYAAFAKDWDAFNCQMAISPDYSYAAMYFVDLDMYGGLGIVGVDLATGDGHIIYSPESGPKQECYQEIGSGLRGVLKMKSGKYVVCTGNGRYLDFNGGGFIDRPDLDEKVEHKQQTAMMPRIADNNPRMIEIVGSDANLVARFVSEEPISATAISDDGRLVAAASHYGRLSVFELIVPNTLPPAVEV